MSQCTWGYFAAFIAMLCVACGDSSDGNTENSPGSSGTFGTYDPCALLTQADSEAAVGIPLKNTRHDTKWVNPIGQKICYYEDASGSDMKLAQMSLNEQNGMQYNRTVEAFFAEYKAGVASVKPIAGLGDDAFYGGAGLKAGAGVTTLIKAKGVMMTILVGLGTGNDDEEAHIRIETDLTRKAINRL